MSRKGKTKIDEEEKVVKKKKEAKLSSKEEEKKYSISQVTIFSIVTVIIGVIIGSLITHNLCCKNGKNSYDDLDEVISVYESINEDYYGTIDKEKLVDGAIRGMMLSLDDPYAMFLDKESALEFNNVLSGDYVGLGVTITGNEEGKLYIVEISKGSPSDVAGLKVGDVILKVDDEEMTGENYLDIIYKIKTSNIGTTKNIEVLRDGETLQIPVVLDKVEFNSVYSSTYEVDDKKVGIIYLTKFAGNTYSQFLKHYEELTNLGVTSLVIDLRNNDGGYLSSATEITSLFIDKGSVIYKLDDGKDLEETVNEKERKIYMPVVLIINSQTASSAEIFASSLLDNLNVDIVGTNSHGKGTVQKVVPLSDGSYIKYSVKEWFSANGNKINNVGVKPTEYVEDDSTDGDAQLEAALSIAINK